MPTSYADSFPPIMHTIIGLAPRRIIDIGCGWGLYGLACRQWLPDLTRLDAIEVPQGRLPTQDVIYDQVIVSDARNVVWDGGYDLALLIDVIEHMAKPDGHRLLTRLVDADISVIVATPKVWIEQHDDNNPYETHICRWGWQDFTGRYRVEADVSTIDALIYLLPSSP